MQLRGNGGVLPRLNPRVTAKASVYIFVHNCSYTKPQTVPKPNKFIEKSSTTRFIH